MKRIVIALCILAGCTNAPTETEVPHWSAVKLLREQHERELTEWERMVMAIALTESRFNPSAVGAANDTGILQLTPVYVAEVNRVSGTDYIREDAFDIGKSLEMFALMQEHYNVGKDINYAIYLHNKSDAYKRKVLENMETVSRYEALRTKLIENNHD